MALRSRYLPTRRSPVRTPRWRDRCRIERASRAPQQAKLGHVLGTDGRW